MGQRVEQRLEDAFALARSPAGRWQVLLFSGDDGAGKRLAAERIAADLGVDLHRIDLAEAVDKYVGDTEENLGRLFDQAEQAGAVLLIDEADALFGKRSEVRDSHDRYANVDIAYLLERIAGHDGIVILTTNHPRDIGVIETFEVAFPDEARRAPNPRPEA